MTEKSQPNLSNEGHRQRIREKFLNNGGSALADYELLEAYLTIAIPRRDVKPLAKQLIAKFGSFAEVINAKNEDLLSISGVGENTVFALKIISEAARRMSWEMLKDKDAPVIADMDALIDYCRMSMAYQDVEEFRLIYLNGKNRVIAEVTQQKGTINHVAIHPREVVKSALATGDTTPSRADIDITKKVNEALSAVNIQLHDHVIVSKYGCYSFRCAGLI